ncbi:MAG TPA: Ig-like domain repeat protein, partial [Acidimicrobiales bacterium]|nr:Ig-like domain repeat protein [Acidimicrobiales bacterium]
VLAVLAAAVPVGAAIARSAPAGASGATLVVTSLGDAPDADLGDGMCDTGDGTCTLRAALDEAGASTGEVIGFSVSGTIAVESTLRIRSPLTIDGTGRRVTVSGGGSVGVFATAIEVAGGGSATIRALTIADGFDGSTGGAAIFNSAASGGEGLVLDGVTVRDNTAAAGAVFGGAVVNTSRLTIRNSTFSGNDADAGTDGSDVSNVFSGSASITQSTFTGSAGSSAVSSTSGDPATITSSIVSGPGFACSGTFTGSGNVTTDDDAICPGTAGVTPSGLGLAALADNGGPTNTVRLLPGSAAVDAGSAGGCTATDQRGAGRPKGAGCDAGAYELDPATATSLTAAPASVPFGGSVTVETTVAASGEPVVPTGEVELFDGTTSLGKVPLVDGSASTDLTALAAGTHDLEAVYVPDAGLASSRSAVRTVTVQRAVPTVTLTSSGSPTGGGEAVSFQVAVTGGGSVPTGSVTVKDAATAIETVALDAAGRAEVVTSSLSGGPHVIVADYSGDANHAPASSAALAHEVVGGSTTVLRGPAGPTVFGNDAVFEVDVEPVPGGRTPTGLVTLFTGPTPVGFANLDATGSATIPVTVLPPGTSSVQASYAGDGYNGASTSSLVDHVVTSAATKTTLSVSPSSTVFGGAVTVDVAVTAVGSPAVPSGTVAIANGSTVITRLTLEADGTASATLPTQPAGTYALHAEFDGATGLDPSTSTVTGHEIAKASTGVALTASSPTSVAGEQVTLTAAVASTSSAEVPVGAVTFRDGTTELGTVAVDGSGAARLDTRAIAVGSRNLTATFDGSNDFASAPSSPLGHTVAKAGVQVSIVASPARTWFGTAVTIDVVVAAASPGSGLPSGSVTIRDGSAVLGTPALDGSGRAALTVSTIAVGERTLTAGYAGDGSFETATASTTLTVDADTTTVIVQTSAPEQGYGRPVTLTAIVQSAGGLVPTGTVTFTGGSRTLGTAMLDGSGRASVTVADLPVGSTLVVAAYAGDGRFAPGSGQRLQQVTASPTSTSLAVVPTSPTVADVVTLTVTVAAPGATLEPAGSVEFLDNGAVIGTVALDGGGQAAFSRRFDRSSHELQARFVATTAWQASSSGRETITPSRVGASIAMSATPTSVLIGGSVTLTAAVPTVPGVPAPTGVINVTDASGALGSVPLVDGVATLEATAPVTPGPWIVSAWYSGDLNYEPVAPTATFVEVAASPTILAVVTTPNPGFALSGDVTVRAHVAAGAGSPPVAGKVRFASDSPVLTSETATVDA